MLIRFSDTLLSRSKAFWSKQASNEGLWFSAVRDEKDKRQDTKKRSLKEKSHRIGFSTRNRVIDGCAQFPITDDTVLKSATKLGDEESYR